MVIIRRKLNDSKMNDIPSSPDSLTSDHRVVADMLNHNITAPLAKRRKVLLAQNGIDIHADLLKTTQVHLDLLKTQAQLEMLKNEPNELNLNDSLDLRQNLLQKNLEMLKTQQSLGNLDTLDLRQSSFNLLRSNLEMLKNSQRNSLDLRLNSDSNLDLRLHIVNAPTKEEITDLREEIDLRSELRQELDLRRDDIEMRQEEMDLRNERLDDDTNMADYGNKHSDIDNSTTEFDMSHTSELTDKDVMTNGSQDGVDDDVTFVILEDRSQTTEDDDDVSDPMIYFSLIMSHLTSEYELHLIFQGMIHLRLKLQPFKRLPGYL